jgi:hypothetical protein
MDSNIWKAIPHGKNDPPRLLFDPGRPQSYDFNDPDSQFVMFNRELAGCFTLPFSKPMRTDLPGRAIAARVVPLRLAGYDTWCLGLKLGGVLHGYGREVAVEVSGFTDTDGNVMEPARLRVRTPDTAGHDPQYAAHEKVARQAAQDGIALLKNDRGVLPLPGSTDDTYTEPLEAAVRDGRVSMGQLQQNVRRLVAGLLRLQKGGL